MKPAESLVSLTAHLLHCVGKKIMWVGEDDDGENVVIFDDFTGITISEGTVLADTKSFVKDRLEAAGSLLALKKCFEEFQNAKPIEKQG